MQLSLVWTNTFDRTFSPTLWMVFTVSPRISVFRMGSFLVKVMPWSLSHWVRPRVYIHVPHMHSPLVVSDEDLTSVPESDTIRMSHVDQLLIVSVRIIVVGQGE